MKIAIMGTGGVGGYFGGLLARAGNEVTFVARGPHLQAIREHGLQVESSNDGDFVVHGNAVEDTTKAGIQDLVLFTVKMYHNQQAIEAVKPMMGPDSLVLTLQNGIDNGQQLVEAYGRERVLIGSCYMEGRIREPGVVTQGGPGVAAFGELEPGFTERCEKLLAVFREANWRVDLQQNMPGMLWKKFSYLAGSAAVGAATRSVFGEMRSIPETRGNHPGSYRGNTGCRQGFRGADNGRLAGMVHDLFRQLPSNRHVVPGQRFLGRTPSGTGRPDRNGHQDGAGVWRSHTSQRYPLRHTETLGFAN